MGQRFSKEQPYLTVEAEIEPKEATDRQLLFRVVDEHGVDSNLVRQLLSAVYVTQRHRQNPRDQPVGIYGRGYGTGIPESL